MAAQCLNLFITDSGETKPTSHMVVATWVRILFKKAARQCATADVASKSWLGNCPLDEFLARGN